MKRRIFEPEHELFREQARRFFQERVAPQASRWQEQGHVDREIYLEAGRLGYLLMWADELYGGAGISDFRYEQIICEENIRHGELGLYLTHHSRLCGAYLNRLGTPEQKRRFLPKCITGESILGIALTEPGAGSDLAGIQTAARQEGDHWILNGSKTYISNGQIGDLFIVAARTRKDVPHGIGLFLVERDMAGFRRGRNLKKMGLAAQDTSELFFDSVRLPSTHVLGDPQRGFHHLMELLAEERLISSVLSISHAQTAFDITLEFVKERRAFGRPIGMFQNSRFKMAQMRAELDALQSFVDQGVVQLNEGTLTPVLAAEMKLLTAELENRVMDECVQLHGGAGYMKEYRICRMFTDARITRILAGSSEIMREIIGRSLGLDERRAG
jgi:acyl-CoA dehydrogenase